MTLASTAVASPPSAIPAPPLKHRQHAAWSSGDYSLIGTTLQIVGESLCEAVDLRAGARVLDVAAGNGNAALAAARRGAVVTASDYVPALLQRAGERAAAERLELELREADAEALPFADASFDVVLSSFGVMFTADHDRAARELLRVCRSGGTIGLANWTPDGFIGQLFKLIGRHVPPAPGTPAPAQWGTRAGIDQWFESEARSITAVPRHFVFRYRTPQHWLDIFRRYYGPILKAFAALPEPAQAELERELLELVARFNRSGDAGMVVPSEYLEVVVLRR